MGETEFFNPNRRLMRGALVASAVTAAFACIAGTILGVGDLDTNVGTGLFCAVTAIMAGCITLAGLFIALVTMFVARAADRVIAEFRTGHALADWTFTPPEWGAFLASQRVRRSKGRLWVAGLAVVLPISFGVGMVAWMMAPRAWIGVANVALVLVGAALLLKLLGLIFAWSDRRYFAMLQRNRRVLVAHNAVYCGGVLTLWNVTGTVLQRIRILADSPMRLEVTTGANQALRTVGMVAGMASVASGGAAAGSAISGMVAQVVIPVPAGREGEAREVMQALLQPVRPPVRMMSVVGPPMRVPVAAPQSRSAPRSVWPWWWIAAGLWAVGLVLFLTAPTAKDGSEEFTNFGLAISVVGLFMWIASLLAAIAAVFGTVRSFRHRAAARKGTNLSGPPS